MDPKSTSQQDYIPPGGFINMARAVCVPFPTISRGPQPILNREETLRTIISNLKTHHQQVRNNILSQAIGAKEWIRQRDKTLDPPVDPQLLHKANLESIANLKTTTRDPNSSVPAFNLSEYLSSKEEEEPVGSNPYMTISAQLMMAMMEEMREKRAEYDVRAEKTIRFYQKALDRNLEMSGVVGGSKSDLKGDSGSKSGGDTIPVLGQGGDGRRKSVTFAPDAIGGDEDGQNQRLGEMARNGNTTPVVNQGNEGRRKSVTFAVEATIEGDEEGQTQRPGGTAKNGSYDATRDPRLR
ncbi:MAG: hypothetical protein M1812_005052 [Candelaria pacifica]|nr:MAG: hypothetical protein M1812_005052 [Candelaria pacifica]